MRRRRALLVAAPAVAVAVAYAAYGAAGDLLDGPAEFSTARDGSYLTQTHQTGGSAVRWPTQGQAALQLGNGRSAASPHQRPAAIASLAKVMTAYLVLQRYPLRGEQDGFTITVSAAEARAGAEDRAEGQSVVAVAAGERLTERQLLEALLIPSGNNIAEMLAADMAGSEPRFIVEMNAQARALGMNHTVYTDPSGFDPGTVSTAADQLRLFQKAIRLPVFGQIVSMGTVTLPIAGTLTNFNPLVAAGFAGKTGSDSAAGGCLAFFTHVTVAERRVTAVGVVLGQGQGDSTSALLAAAGEAAEQLVDSLTPTGRVRTNATSGAGGHGLTPSATTAPAATRSRPPLGMN